MVNLLNWQRIIWNLKNKRGTDMIIKEIGSSCWLRSDDNRGYLWDVRQTQLVRGGGSKL